MREQNFMITKKINILHIAVLLSLSFAQILFFNKGYFYSRSFQKYSMTSRKIQGLFKDILQNNLQFSRTFQGHDAFSKNFQGPCEP